MARHETYRVDLGLPEKNGGCRDSPSFSMFQPNREKKVASWFHKARQNDVQLISQN